MPERILSALFQPFVFSIRQKLTSIKLYVIYFASDKPLVH